MDENEVTAPNILQVSISVCMCRTTKCKMAALLHYCLLYAVCPHTECVPPPK